MASSSLTSSDDLLICTACGTQFDETDGTVLTSCHICDDPRQYVPPTGQSFTTLTAMKSSSKYTNKHASFPTDDRFTHLWTEPKFAIGQQCILIQTPSGNVLWDCITYLDSETITWIKSLGGLAAIVISHPHFYTTHLEWAWAFNCPVYLSLEDEKWLSRKDGTGHARRFIQSEEVDIGNTGVKAIKLGGHFPGSLVSLYDGRLLVADTLLTTPSGMGNWGEKPRPKGMNSFAFMWSIPNLIPLPPDEIVRMWSVLKKHEFRSTHGAFAGMNVIATDVKTRVLQSMQIQIKNEGYMDHPLLNEG